MKTYTEQDLYHLSDQKLLNIFGATFQRVLKCQLKQLAASPVRRARWEEREAAYVRRNHLIASELKRRGHAAHPSW